MAGPTISPHSRRTVHRAGEIRRATGTDVRRMREDAGVSLSALARATGISVTHLWGVEAGSAEASTEVLVAIAQALGADLTVRLYPVSGPRIRDHIQARVGEAVLRTLHPRWSRFLEVPVYRPVRGVIDLVLHDPSDHQIVSLELHSEIRRMEQQIRWAHQKHDSLPSSEMWRFLSEEPRLSNALVLRNTRQNRQTVASMTATMRTEFPASHGSAVEALVRAAPWPGPALLWVDVGAGGDRLLERPPRGISVGR